MNGQNGHPVAAAPWMSTTNANYALCLAVQSESPHLTIVEAACFDFGEKS